MSFLTYVKTILKTKAVYERDNAIQVAITSAQLETLKNRVGFETPSEQTDLNAVRVDEILKAHYDHPAFDLSKNCLTLAVQLGNRGRKAKWFLMDGQHRLEAMKTVEDFPFLITIQNTPSNDDLRELFRQINLDSHKNRPFILLSKEDAKLADDLYDHLKQTNGHLFKDGVRLRTLREFVDMLGNTYFSRFSDFETMRADFEKKNADFIDVVNPYFDHCYADEKACCEAGFIPPLKEANFVDNLLNGAAPCYVGKKRGNRAINAALKNAVWHAHFPTTLEGKCTCCRASTIGSRNFDCGHVVSVHAGGKTVLGNLRPVCGNCNSSMGKKNMDEFIKECGF